MKLKISLALFIGALLFITLFSQLVRFYSQSLGGSEVEAYKATLHNDKLHKAKPQGAVELLSTNKIQLEPNVRTTSAVEIGVSAGNVLIDTITSHTGNGLIYSLDAQELKNIHQPKFTIPVTFGPMPSGRYYLYFDVALVSASGDLLSMPQKTLGVIVQVGAEPAGEVKFQKMASGEHYEVLPAEEVR